MSYAKLPRTVKAGDRVYIADGALILTVKEVRETEVVTVCNCSCKLGEKKNVNLPGTTIDLPAVTEKDVNDLQNFAVKYGVEYVAASFVRKGSDIDEYRECMGPAGRRIKIIAKIENEEVRAGGAGACEWVEACVCGCLCARARSCVLLYARGRPRGVVTPPPRDRVCATTTRSSRRRTASWSRAATWAWSFLPRRSSSRRR